MLTETQRKQLIDQAIAGRPNEICGLLGGRWQRDHGHVHLVIHLPNVAATPHVRYQVGQKAFIDAYRQIERCSDDLIGIYHSHPSGAAIPSATDLAEATWPDIAYLIIGFPDGESPKIEAWTIKHRSATAVGVIVEPD